jgi:hypothetical protein
MQYVSIYSGPNYEIFMKYAFMMKFIAISFVFGYSLPVLFPITFLALVNLYVTDKYALAYLYQKPPNYDGKIIIKAIELLKIPLYIGIIFTLYFAGNN